MPIYSNNKLMRSKSTTKLHFRSSSKPKEPSIVGHRKEIESTLRQLHRLQSEIYELNVPENPHSSSPVKKEIKQLSYLYENMAKPKSRNNLNIKSEDIELAARIMNKDWNPEVELQDEIQDDNGQLGKTKSNFSLQPDATYKLPKSLLQQKFEAITNCSINLAFINDNEDCQEMSVKDLYAFLNYTETDTFDPVEEAYQMFLNEKGEFDINIYNNFNEVLGLPRLKSFNNLIAAITHATNPATQSSSNTITLEQFREIIKMKL